MMKELRIAKVGNNDLIIKPILKSFYCCYCDSIAQCASSPHRSGFWVVFEASRYRGKFYLGGNLYIDIRPLE
jgi:ATP sulfurylase